MNSHREANRNSPKTRPRLGLGQVTFGATTLAVFTLLALASMLEPNPSGIGTHRGLGLPACVWVELMGIRCPSCGMTTSWAWMARGEVGHAVRANPAGALLFLQALFSLPFLAWGAIHGKLKHQQLFEWLSIVAGVLAVVIALVDWGFRLKLG